MTDRLSTTFHYGTNAAHSDIPQPVTKRNQFNYCPLCNAGFYRRAPSESKHQTAKQQAYLFFLRNAGYSYNPETQTKQAGRSECARKLAKAERDARALGYTFEWRDDWSVGNHFKEYGECYANGEPSTCESCLMLDDGEVVQSLGCIDDATRDYRRVVEAELALEQL